FKKIPGSPIAYWVNEAIRDNFAKMIPLESIAPARQGLGTGNNAQFVRFWFEVSNKKIHNSARNKNEAYSSGCKWFPYTKGGGFKKWYGNDLD
ncbi:BREX-1 system adenine-specific DNA-methyltransferase PglX, partial [Klebsiella pneumoniae]|nr:BREX-1 system adenine-specific DNA-methyltransferase PglX [Klebsiella pneumoniae]